MRRNMIESVMGAVVLLVAASFVFFAVEMAQVKAVDGYRVDAIFYRVGGLARGSDVRISGIRVGSVVDRRLDEKTFDAVVTLSIASDVKVPVDSVAAIAREGLLGEKYVQLKPGSETSYLSNGSVIQNTEDYKSLEDQVGEIIFLATGGER
jgi:phospholipid/cholesterol/gamma-HCH transport system substrate-binding protein